MLPIRLSTKDQDNKLHPLIKHWFLKNNIGNRNIKFGGKIGSSIAPPPQHRTNSKGERKEDQRPQAIRRRTLFFGFGGFMRMRLAVQA
jgi:hypothetical protein